MPPPTINTILFGLPKTFVELLIQAIQETSEEQKARAEKEFLMISKDELFSLIIDYYDSSEDEQDPSILEYISMPRAFTPHSMMQRRTMDITFLMDGEVINCSYTYKIDESLKVEQNKLEVWDLLGQPSRKFNYEVKYSVPSITHVLPEDIVPSR